MRCSAFDFTADEFLIRFNAQLKKDNGDTIKSCSKRRRGISFSQNKGGTEMKKLLIATAAAAATVLPGLCGLDGERCYPRQHPRL
jgi:hypothetical protein